MSYHRFPPPPRGPKECKHSILFDFKVLILYFKQMLIHICTATFENCEVRQDFCYLWHRLLIILTASFGEFVSQFSVLQFVQQQTFRLRKVSITLFLSLLGKIWITLLSFQAICKDHCFLSAFRGWSIATSQFTCASLPLFCLHSLPRFSFVLNYLTYQQNTFHVVFFNELQTLMVKKADVV